MELKPLRPKPGPVLSYLENLPIQIRAKVEASVVSILETDDGVILLNLLEKAVQDRQVSIGAPPGALEDLNAQRILVSDLQQIVRPENAYLEPVHGGVPVRSSPRRRG